VSAAIEVLAEVSGDTVLVLGDMAELGEDAQQLHAEIGSKAKNAGVNALYATGKYSENTVAAFGDNGFWFEYKNGLAKALKENLKAGDTVLIKGSRSAAMEEVVEQILTPKNNNKRVN
jgi:UDP-N-acetylmuramoyl-tripeptide--D-alanyl-D-alanine ligase